MFKSRNPVVFNDVIFTDTQYKRPLIAELLLRLVSVIPMTVTVVKQFFFPPSRSYHRHSILTTDKIPNVKEPRIGRSILFDIDPGIRR